MRVIAGTARSLKLKTLPGMDTRPTTDRIKETLFNMISSYVPDSRFLDLYSGSGGIAIEALSRGAYEAVLVEKNRKACDIIKQNLSFTNLIKNAEVVEGDVHSVLRSLKGVFDIVFMDPPYNTEQEKPVLEALIRYGLIDENSLVIIEASLNTDLSFAEDLGYSIDKIKEYKTNAHIFLRMK